MNAMTLVGRLETMTQCEAIMKMAGMTNSKPFLDKPAGWWIMSKWEHESMIDGYQMFVVIEEKDAPSSLYHGPLMPIANGTEADFAEVFAGWTVQAYQIPGKANVHGE